MSKVPTDRAGASSPASATPPLPTPAGRAELMAPPVELSLGLNLSVRVGTSRWYARRLVVYADAGARRYRCTLHLDRPADEQGDPLDARRTTCELVGQGHTLAIAVGQLYDQLAPPAPVLWPVEG